MANQVCLCQRLRFFLFFYLYVMQTDSQRQKLRLIVFHRIFPQPGVEWTEKKNPKGKIKYIQGFQFNWAEHTSTVTHLIPLCCYITILFLNCITSIHLYMSVCMWKCVNVIVPFGQCGCVVRCHSSLHGNPWSPQPFQAHQRIRPTAAHVRGKKFGVPKSSVLS